MQAHLKKYRKSIVISSGIAIFSDVSKRCNILLSQYIAIKNAHPWSWYRNISASWLCIIPHLVMHLGLEWEDLFQREAMKEELLEGKGWKIWILALYTDMAVFNLTAARTSECAKLTVLPAPATSLTSAQFPSSRRCEMSPKRFLRHFELAHLITAILRRWNRKQPLESKTWVCLKNIAESADAEG